MSGVRQLIAAAGFLADANVQPRQPADAAAWVWHPRVGTGETAFLRFSLVFEVATEGPAMLHVSSDQRFQLRLDGDVVGFGPDRGDVEKWPVATYAVSLRAGVHRLEALVWWLKDESLGSQAPAELAHRPVRPPVAQATWRGGFLLAGEGALAERLNTGRAPWQVEVLTSAIRPVAPTFYAYHDIGPEFHVRGDVWSRATARMAAEVVAQPILGNPHGVQRPGWRLQPTTLPEQARRRMRRGRLRSLCATWNDGPVIEAVCRGTEAEDWRQLFHGVGKVTIPAHSERTLIWDFEDYVCAYATLATQGGLGARVRIDWAEALHASPTRAAVTARTPKGDRDVIAGKVCFGFGDEYFPVGDELTFPSLWWRSGRYLRVQVRTVASALVLTELAITTTGYPLGEAVRFESDDTDLNAVAARSETTIRACAHEVWTDCPYYEQMAYVGDCRLAALNNYALFADDRLSRRMLGLFDDSRRGIGLVAERTPAVWAQVSVTYSLWWTLMVRDFAWWRDDAAQVRVHLRGVRAMLEEVLALTDAGGLLRQVPGWSFIDWVPAWDEGCGPGVREGDSSLLNLQLLLALQAHVELETFVGEPELATLATRRAQRLAAAISERYWSASRGLLADDGAQSAFSEHAQALGLLAGIVPPGGRAAWVGRWRAANNLAAATIYFRFYVLEALRLTGQIDEWHERLQLWRDLLPTGLRTMPEAPEPTRSDCHGWSAHVRWHLAATLAGVRPAAPGFSRVEIAPWLGRVRTLATVVRHPHGDVRVTLSAEGDRLHGTVTLPEATTGEFRWRGAAVPLQPGENTLALSAGPEPS